MKYQGITIHKSPYANTWFTRYRKNGVQHFISAKTQKDCYNKLKKALQHDNVVESKTTMPTLLQWYEKWLNLYKIGKVKQNTLREYTTMLRYIPNETLQKEINQIVLSEVLTIINNCDSERQKQKLYDFLNMLFKKAYDNDLVNKNIIERIDKPKHEKVQGQALTNKEQKILIEACKLIKNADFMLVALFQGLRRGEVLGLTRDNINFVKNELTINKSYNQQNQFDTTKNKQSMRTMPLFNESKQILQRYADRQPNERIFDITTKQHELIMKEIKQKSQIPNLKTKDMRTTFITRCSEENIPEFVIQSWVGHKIGSKVTKQVYTKFNAEDNYKYIDILNNSKLYSNYTQLKK